MPKKPAKKKASKGKKNGINLAAKSAHKKLKAREKQLKAQLKKAMG